MNYDTVCSDGGKGRHEALKKLWPELAVWVRIPFRVQTNQPN